MRKFNNNVPLLKILKENKVLILILSKIKIRVKKLIYIAFKNNKIKFWKIKLNNRRKRI